LGGPARLGWVSDREIGAEDEVVVDAEEPWPRLRRLDVPLRVLDLVAE